MSSQQQTRDHQNCKIPAYFCPTRSDRHIDQRLISINKRYEHYLQVEEEQKKKKDMMYNYKRKTAAFNKRKAHFQQNLRKTTQAQIKAQFFKQLGQSVFVCGCRMPFYTYHALVVHIQMQHGDKVPRGTVSGTTDKNQRYITRYHSSVQYQSQQSQPQEGQNVKKQAIEVDKAD